MKSSKEKTNVWEGMGNDWMSKKYQTGQMKWYALHNFYVELTAMRYHRSQALRGLKRPDGCMDNERIQIILSRIKTLIK